MSFHTNTLTVFKCICSHGTTIFWCQETSKCHMDICSSKTDQHQCEVLWRECFPGGQTNYWTVYFLSQKYFMFLNLVLFYLSYKFYFRLSSLALSHSHLLLQHKNILGCPANIAVGCLLGHRTRIILTRLRLCAIGAFLQEASEFLRLISSLHHTLS